MDTTRIVKDSDFEKLDECIPFLIKSSFGNLLSEVRILDPAVAKIYVISQLAVQYLLFCTKFLDKSIQSSRENIFNYQTKVVQTEETIRNQNNEIDRLKLKIQELENRRQYSCPKCTRVFMNPAQFETHLLQDHEQEQKEKEKDVNLITAIKLQIEVKKLKERLNVTEKELMSKTCEKCLENSKRKFENVAVQSNFEEKEKDDTEKEAIQEVLNAQLKQFEEWKRSEESHYREDIEALTAKCERSINEMKEKYEKYTKQPPKPVPRIRKAPQSDESLWKTRFDELEKMHRLELEKHVLTMKSMEKSYREKMREIENSNKETAGQSSPSIEPPKLNRQYKPPVELSSPPTPPSTQVRRLESPKILITVREESSSGSSDESEEIVQEALKQSVKKTQLVEKLPPKKRGTFSSQKYDVNEWKTRENSRKTIEKENRRSAQKIADAIFAQRMKAMGVPMGRSSLSSKDFEKIQSNLVGQRDKVRKKHSNFFITRQKIQSKVDSIFHSKKSTLKVESSGSKKPSKSKICSQVAQTSTPESIQQVQVRKNVASTDDMNSTYTLPDDSNQMQFRDELERMIYQRQQRNEAEIVKIKETQNITDIQDSAQTPLSLQKSPQSPLPPPPVQSSKKVLFDLHESPEFFQKSSKKPLNDEDSDFDISSFTSNETNLK